MSEFQRQHPAAAVDQLFTLIRKNIVTFVVIFFLGTRGDDNRIFLYIFLGSFVLSLATGFFSWWRFRYRIKEDELQIQKGILVRKHLYLSKDRIQVIDVTEGIVQRIFGLVKVEIKTAGSGTESATISAISKSEANYLISELRAPTNSPISNTIHSEEVQPHELKTNSTLDTWQISKKDLMMAAFTSGNFGLIASILGATAGQLDSFINEENLDYLLDHLPGLNNVTLIIAIVITIIAVSWSLSFLGVILKYSDFKVEKTEKELILTSGLIEKKHITIPFNRIQAIRFVEGVIRQPLGYGMLYVESAGFEVKENEKSIMLIPYISKNDINVFFERFLPDYHHDEPVIKPPKRSLIKFLRRPNYLLIIALPFSWYAFDYGWSIIFLSPFLAYLGWLQYRDTGISTKEGLITLRYRTLARVTAFVKRNRIQVVDRQVNPFQARKNLASLTITAASGAKGIAFKAKDLDSEDIQTTLGWILNKN